MSNPIPLLPIRLARYWPEFLQAGTKHGVDPVTLAAICEQESKGGEALEPKGPAGTGDNGCGLGLMQVDKRWHKAFAELRLPDGSYAWTSPPWNIDKGAEILSVALNLLDRDELAAIAAYNAGVNAARRARDVITKPARGTVALEVLVAALDQVTTHHNYVSKVLEHRAAFKR